MSETEEMIVREAANRKTELENRIGDLLEQFTEETGLDVAYISADRMPGPYNSSKIVYLVEVEARL